MKPIDHERKLYLHLFGVAFFLVMLINTGNLNSGDAAFRLQVTHWIWQHAPQVIVTPNCTGFSAIGRFGLRYVTWGIGESLIMLPGDMLARLLIKAGHLQRSAAVINAGVVSYATFPLLNAVLVCLACGVLRELGFSVRDAVLGAFALLFGTSFLVYAQIQQENSLMLFCLVAGTWGNLRWLRLGQLRYILLGTGALGFGLLVRLPAIFDAAAVYFLVVGMAVIRQNREQLGLAARIRYLGTYTALFSAIYLPFIAGDRFYQWLRFGSITTTYTSIWGAQTRALTPSLPLSFPFDAPFSQGFFGQLFSPDRSLFLFNPLVILTIILLVRFWRVLDIQLKLWFFAAGLLLLADIALYAKWFEWDGAGAWGPRYAVVPSEYLALIGVPIFLKFQSHIKSAFEKMIYLALIAVSVFIQLLSILFDYNLELSQEASFHARYIVVWQRLVNTWAVATGSFMNSKLVPTTTTAAELPKYLRLAFMPWRTEGLLPPHVSDILQFFWFIGASVFLVYLAAVFRLLRNTRLTDHATRFNAKVA